MSLKEDFVDWKRHPITEIMMGQLKQRYEDIKEMLVERAGSVQQGELAELAGAAKAIRDVLEISYDDFEGKANGN